MWDKLNGLLPASIRQEKPHFWKNRRQTKVDIGIEVQKCASSAWCVRRILENVSYTLRVMRRCVCVCLWVRRKEQARTLNALNRTKQTSRTHNKHTPCIPAWPWGCYAPVAECTVVGTKAVSLLKWTTGTPIWPQCPKNHILRFWENRAHCRRSRHLHLHLLRHYHHHNRQFCSLRFQEICVSCFAPFRSLRSLSPAPTLAKTFLEQTVCTSILQRTDDPVLYFLFLKIPQWTIRFLLLHSHLITGLLFLLTQLLVMMTQNIFRFFDPRISFCPGWFLWTEQ